MFKYILLAIAVSALGSPVAFSEPLADEVAVVVRHGDLDLSSSAGVEVLRQRIHAAAREICGAEPWISDLDRQAAHRNCIAAAEASAVTQTERAVGEAHGMLARR